MNEYGPCMFVCINPKLMDLGRNSEKTERETVL